MVMQQLSNGRPRFEGFTPADQIVVKPRMIISCQGDAKMGKTHFCLTGPEPIAVIDIDDGIYRPIDRFKGKKKIYVKNYRRIYSELMFNGDSIKATEAAASRQLDIIRDFYIRAIDDGARTVLVDGGAELYEIVRLAAFGKLERAAMSREYGPVNREMKFWLDYAKNHDANVIFTHHLREKYINDKPSGMMEAEGWKKMSGGVDVIIQPWIEEKDPLSTRYHLTIMQCGLNAALDGKEIPSSEFPEAKMDFASLGKLVFPNSKDSDWK